MHILQQQIDCVRVCLSMHVFTSMQIILFLRANIDFKKLAKHFHEFYQKEGSFATNKWLEHLQLAKIF